MATSQTAHFVPAAIPAVETVASPEQLQTALALAEAFATVQGSELDHAISLLNALLSSRPFWPATQHAALMRLIMTLTRRREDAELAANPARRAGIERVAEHFARKAQSGFSPLPLPE